MPNAAALPPRHRTWKAWLIRMIRPPRRLRPTRAGMFLLSAPIVLGVAAVNASNNLLLILLGIALGIIVTSGVLSERNLRGLAISVRPVGELWAGEPARLLVTLIRDARAMARGSTFLIRFSERPIRRPWFSPRPRDREERLEAELVIVEGPEGRTLAERLFTRRGLQQLRACELSTVYPFGLFQKIRDVPLELSLTIWPRRIETPPELADPLGLIAEGVAAQDRGLGEDIYGLRERGDRDPPQRVHALRSLWLGREVVVETERTERPTAWLGIANLDGADAAAFERTLEIAAATYVSWAEQGYAVGVVTATEIFAPDRASREAVLDRLGTLDLEDTLKATSAARPIWLIPAGASPRLPPGQRSALIDAEGQFVISGVRP